jgi:mRNA-degrading endonuclease toxin of MazEF toxin-antitoxin module
VKRGEIWRVRLPAVPGHTQVGERPAIIVQEGKFNAALPTVLTVRFTSTQRATRFPGTLLIQPDPHNGFSVPSVVLVFPLSALDRQNCLAHLGNLDAATLDQIFALLDQLMGR